MQQSTPDLLVLDTFCPASTGLIFCAGSKLRI
jgi:hypothetical protein